MHAVCCVFGNTLLNYTFEFVKMVGPLPVGLEKDGQQTSRGELSGQSDSDEEFLEAAAMRRLDFFADSDGEPDEDELDGELLLGLHEWNEQNHEDSLELRREDDDADMDREPVVLEGSVEAPDDLAYFG